MPNYHKCEASWHLSMACICPGGASVRSVRWTARSQSRGQRMTTQLAVRTSMPKNFPMKTASTTTRTISTRRSKKNRHLRRSLISRGVAELLRQERSRFRRNRPVPVARSLADHRKIKSGRHMTGAMCHSPRESRRRRRLHQALKKDSRGRWRAFGHAD